LTSTPASSPPGDDLKELGASLEEEICLILAEPGDKTPHLRLSELKLGPGDTTAKAELTPA
jgi:hypothetical protein